MKKVVLVTGSSSGIGLAIVKKLVPNYEVILCYNQGKERAVNLKRELDNIYNKDILTVKCDLSKESEIDEMLNIIYNRYSNIDVLINNAGIDRDSLFEYKTKKDFMDTYEVNTIAPFLLAKKIGIKMKQKGSGNIINISSTNGIDTVYPESVDYDASKAALISISKNLANYLAPEVRVNTICPGWVKTDMNKNLSSEFKKREENKILLGRFAEPIEIANVVKFLISDDASYINNSIIRVDGGVKC